MFGSLAAQVPPPKPLTVAKAKSPFGLAKLNSQEQFVATGHVSWGGIWFFHLNSILHWLTCPSIGSTAVRDPDNRFLNRN